MGNAKPPNRAETPIDRWFGDSPNPYLVLSRLGLQEMPIDWQERFIALLNEAHEHHELRVHARRYEVKRRNEKGKIISDPWANWRHGTSREAKATERALGLKTERKDEQ
jgi:hypothetical protein